MNVAINDEKRKRVNNKLRRRAVRRAGNYVREYLRNYVERQMRMSRLSPFNLARDRRYYVKHDYSIAPLEELINSDIDKIDPYEGQDLMNIDHMNNEDPVE